MKNITLTMAFAITLGIGCGDEKKSTSSSGSGSSSANTTVTTMIDPAADAKASCACTSQALEKEGDAFKAAFSKCAEFEEKLTVKYLDAQKQDEFQKHLMECLAPLQDGIRKKFMGE